MFILLCDEVNLVKSACWPKSDSKVTRADRPKETQNWLKSDSAPHVWVIFEPLLSHLGSVWGGAPGATFESLLCHFNSSWVSVELGARRFPKVNEEVCGDHGLPDQCASQKLSSGLQSRIAEVPVNSQFDCSCVGGGLFWNCLPRWQCGSMWSVGFLVQVFVSLAGGSCSPVVCVGLMQCTCAYHYVLENMVWSSQSHATCILLT